VLGSQPLQRGEDEPALDGVIERVGCGLGLEPDVVADEPGSALGGPPLVGQQVAGDGEQVRPGVGVPGVDLVQARSKVS